MPEPHRQLLRRYRNAREHCENLQCSIDELLARFAGEPGQQLTLRDYAHMEGLRTERDSAWDRARNAEQQIFDRLGTSLGIRRSREE